MAARNPELPQKDVAKQVRPPVRSLFNGRTSGGVSRLIKINIQTYVYKYLLITYTTDMGVGPN